MIVHATVKTTQISTNAQSAVLQMWECGPLRRWSPVKTPQNPLGHSTGFVGSYVCGQCLEPCEGVYRLREPKKWVCGPCKGKFEHLGVR